MTNIISRSTVLLAFVLILCSCSTTKGLSILRPEIDNDRNIAIVSIHSNAALYNLERTESLPSLAQRIGRKGDLDPYWGEEVFLKKANSFFLNELSKIDGWNIVPIEEFIQSEAYIDFAVKYNRHGRNYGLRHRVAYSTYPGMANIIIRPRLNENLTSKLAELARDLGVDAVAVVQLDVAYQTLNFETNVPAKLSVAASLCIVDTTEKVLVNTPWEIREGQGIRQTSIEPGAFVRGGMTYNPKTKRLFEEALQKNADFFREQITGVINS